MNSKVVLLGSLTVSWLGTAANLAAEAKSILGAFAALASMVASCYAVAIARQKFKGVKRAARKERKAIKTTRRGLIHRGSRG